MFFEIIFNLRNFKIILLITVFIYKYEISYLIHFHHPRFNIDVVPNHAREYSMSKHRISERVLEIGIKWIYHRSIWYLIPIFILMEFSLIYLDNRWIIRKICLGRNNTSLHKFTQTGIRSWGVLFCKIEIFIFGMLGFRFCIYQLLGFCHLISDGSSI